MPRTSRTQASPSLDHHLVSLLCLLSESGSFLDRSAGGFLLPGISATVSLGRWQPTSRPADPLCLTQAPKGRISGLPTTSGGKRFQLWALGLFCTERHLAKRLKDNSFYPFTQQQPNGARGAGTRTRRGRGGGPLSEARRGEILLATGRGLDLGSDLSGGGSSPGRAPKLQAGCGRCPSAACSRRPESWPCHPRLRAGWSSRAAAALPAVFVLEYYLDTLWKGALLFVVCLFLVSFGLVSQV